MKLTLVRILIHTGAGAICSVLVIGSLGCGGSGAPDIPEPPMGEMPSNENPQEKDKPGKKKRKKKDPSPYPTPSPTTTPN